MNDDLLEYDKYDFYKILETQFTKQLELVKSQSGIICIPINNLNELTFLSYDFIAKHLYIPSPYFKDEYRCLNRQQDTDSYSISIDNETKCLFVWLKEKIHSKIKILSEQIGYTSDYKEYLILLIEHPIHTELNNNINNHRKQQLIQVSTISKVYSHNDVYNLDKSLDFLVKCYSNQLTEELISQIQTYKQTHILVPKYIHDCSNELFKIYQENINKFISCTNKIEISNEIELLSIAIENLIIGFMFNKLDPLVCIHNKNKDLILNEKIEFYRKTNANLNAFISKLNIDSKLLIDYKMSIRELEKIDSFNTTFEKLNCLKCTFDMINTELLLFYKKHDFANDLMITSDILLPLICFIILKSKLNGLYSLVYFIEIFNLRARNSDSIDEYSFAFATFKAAVNLIYELNE